MGRRAELKLLQGTLDLLVLKSLEGGALHGYGVAAWVRERTGGAIEIEDGALYTSLHRLERRGWVAAEWGVSENNRKAKYYELTSAGRRHMSAEVALWERYAAAVSSVVRWKEASS